MWTDIVYIILKTIARAASSHATKNQQALSQGQGSSWKRVLLFLWTWGPRTNAPLCAPCPCASAGLRTRFRYRFNPRFHLKSHFLRTHRNARWLEEAIFLCVFPYRSCMYLAENLAARSSSTPVLLTHSKLRITLFALLAWQQERRTAYASCYDRWRESSSTSKG